MFPQDYLAPYVTANLIALGILGLAFWRPRWVRWCWVAIFAWASLANTWTVAGQPLAYLTYGALTPSDLYRAFIDGWFSAHIQPMVLTIATGQMAIAILLAEGTRGRRLGELGAIIFLLAIAPLGIGSGFPFSLTAIASILVMERRLRIPDTRPSRAARFVPDADVRELHTVVVRAPADVVLDVAANTDVQALPLVRFIFALRSRLMRDTAVARRARGLVPETLALGWGMLSYATGRHMVLGAATRPWMRDVSFEPIPPEQFAAFSEPDFVKIVWTLEADPLGPALTRFTTETRVAATDAGARRKFRWYWRAFGVGIVLIRVMMVRAVKRQAERKHRAHAQPLAHAA
jgi:hypothetical protein